MIFLSIHYCVTQVNSRTCSGRQCTCLSHSMDLHVCYTVHMQEEAEFADGDDYHSSANLRKMSSGQPLTDEVCVCA